MRVSELLSIVYFPSNKTPNPDRVNLRPHRKNMTVSLELIDGTKRTFTFEPPPNQELRIAARVKEFLNSNSDAFQLPDQLLVIPKSQIKSIEFSPPLDKQIDGVFGHTKEL